MCMSLTRMWLKKCSGWTNDQGPHDPYNTVLFTSSRGQFSSEVVGKDLRGGIPGQAPPAALLLLLQYSLTPSFLVYHIVPPSFLACHILPPSSCTISFHFPLHQPPTFTFSHFFLFYYIFHASSSCSIIFSLLQSLTVLYPLLCHSLTFICILLSLLPSLALKCPHSLLLLLYTSLPVEEVILFLRCFFSLLPNKQGFASLHFDTG